MERLLYLCVDLPIGMRDHPWYGRHILPKEECVLNFQSQNTQRRIGPGASSTTALQNQRDLERRHEAQRQQEQNKSGTDKSGTENSPSSRSQAPMPHPILKKTRGPSNSGPRPTARFISPHDTEDEASPVTSESTNSHVVVEPPSPMDPRDPQAEKKPSIVAGKKKAGFVASTKKRRPIIVKRQSSQSSTESAARNAESAQFSAMQSSAERTPPTFAAQSRTRPQSRFQENFSPSSGQSLSNVQSPKRRVVSRTNSNKHVSPRKPGSGSRKPKAPSDGADQTASAGGPGPSTTHHREENQIETLADPETLTEEDLHELEVQRILLEEANARVERQNQRAAQLLEQAQTEVAAAKQVRQTSHGSSAALNLLSQDSKSKSTSTVGITPTLVAPSGQLALGAFGDCASDGLQMSSRSASMGRLDKGKGRDPEELRRTAMFAKRPIQPVQETATASLDTSSTLSRSKSQLTLLLEKDRKRGGNSNDKSSKSPRDKGK